MGIKTGMKIFKVPGWGLYEDQRKKPKYGAFQCVPRRNSHKQSLTHNPKTCRTCTPKIVIETVLGLAGCRGDRNIEIVLQARRGHESVFSIQILRCPPNELQARCNTIQTKSRVLASRRSSKTLGSILKFFRRELIARFELLKRIHPHCKPSTDQRLSS